MRQFEGQCLDLQAVELGLSAELFGFGVQRKDSCNDTFLLCRIKVQSSEFGSKIHARIIPKNHMKGP